MEEKEQRGQRFLHLCHSLRPLFTCMEREPKSPLEQLIFSSNYNEQQEIIILSLETLTQLEELKHNLKSAINANKVEAEGYWVKIKELWSRLDVDEDLKDAFVNVHCGFQPETQDVQGPIFTPSVLKGVMSHIQYICFMLYSFDSR